MNEKKLNEKNRKARNAVSAAAIVCSFLAATVACGFVGGTDMAFGWKFLCNALFMVTPLLIVTAILAWTKKES